MVSGSLFGPIKAVGEKNRPNGRRRRKRDEKVDAGDAKGLSVNKVNSVTLFTLRPQASSKLTDEVFAKRRQARR